MKKLKITKEVGRDMLSTDISEDKLQSDCHLWLYNNFPQFRGCAWHVANERNTSKAAGAILKSKGVVAGVPDYVFNFANKTYYFELKTSVGTLSPAQKEVHAALRKQGFIVEIIRTVEEFKFKIEEIMRN
jgi:hypothetical protein